MNGILGRKGISWLCSIGVMLVTMLMSISAYIECGLLGNKVLVCLGSWIGLGLGLEKWSLLFDSLSVSMLLVVCLISGIVHMYSFSYMKEDSSRQRYMMYLTMFSGFMLLVVLAENMLMVFIGFELIGLCSYKLIGFWNKKIGNKKNGMQAVMINRIGDIGMIVSMIWLYCETKSLKISLLFLLVLEMSGEYREVIGYGLLLGSFSKSAQIGFSIWLTNAMTGLTPVSALMHAATMVTVGVYLVIRLSGLFVFSKGSLVLMVIVGGITVVYAGLVGVVQQDIKKVIAYSTGSQLGYMMIGCGLGEFSKSMFHLVMHAGFKAMLFLGAGMVIHSLRDEQDLRRMGGIRKVLLVSYSMIVIGSLSLVGCLFLSGYYSKEMIVNVSMFLESIDVLKVWVYLCLLCGVLLTVMYSLKIWEMVFVDSYRGQKREVKIAREEKELYVLVLLLVIVSVLGGYMSMEGLIGIGSDFWGNVIIEERNKNMIEFSGELVWIVLGVMILGVVMMVSFRSARFRMVIGGQGRVGLSKRWIKKGFMLERLVVSIMNVVMVESIEMTKKLDKGMFELIGLLGLYEEYKEQEKKKYRYKGMVAIGLGGIGMLFLLISVSVIVYVG